MDIFIAICVVVVLSIPRSPRCLGPSSDHASVFHSPGSLTIITMITIAFIPMHMLTIYLAIIITFGIWIASGSILLPINRIGTIILARASSSESSVTGLVLCDDALLAMGELDHSSPPLTTSKAFSLT